MKKLTETKLITREGQLRLLLEIPVNSVLPISSTGKSLIVAATDGFEETEQELNGKKIVIRLHVVISK